MIKSRPLPVNPQTTGDTMKAILFVLAVVACAFVAEGLEKAPKNVRSLKRLCERATSRKGISSDNEDVTMVFDDLTEWCGPFLANYSDVYRKMIEPLKYNPEKQLTKICEWHNNKYPEDASEGLFVGFGDICDDFFEAIGEPIDQPPRVPKAIEKLTTMCTRADKDKLKWRNESYDDVFEFVIEWCPDFLDAEAASMEMMMKYDPILEMDFICQWFVRKYDDEPPTEGSLVGLDAICDDFNTVRYG